MKLAIPIILALLLTGCATPERTVSVLTWAGDTDSTRTLATSHETGLQLFFGARSTLLTGPGASAIDSIDKTDMAAVAKVALGAALGAYLGGVPGAAVGGVGGAVVAALTGDQGTSSTLGVK